MKLPHFTEGTQATRSNLRRANRLTEPGCPEYNGTPESIHAIIEWLNVEKSARYQPDKFTYCNIYAYDYADKLGAYLPRVWWNTAALKRVNSGEDMPVIYPRNGVPGTIVEMNANSIYEWFKNVAPKVGWRKIESKTEAQNLANAGKCVIMVGANLVSRSSGHITAIVPETDKHKAAGSKGISNVRTVLVPLQSQAGRTCWKYRAFDWQKGHQPILMYVWEGQ